MTYREVVRAAYQQIGIPEDRIAHYMQQADYGAYDARVDTEYVLKPNETYEAKIAEVAAMLKSVLSLPPIAKAVLYSEIEKVLAKRRRNN